VRSLGWCVNPKLRSIRERQVVNRTEFACNRLLFDYWEPQTAILSWPPNTKLGSFRLAPLFGVLLMVGASLAFLTLLTTVTFATILARPQASVPTVNPAAPQVAPTPLPSPTPAVVRVKIGNTDGLGAYLRPEPNLQARGVVAWPDGSVLEVVGPDRQFDGKVWRNVKDSRGNVGWILREYLLPAE
jgi:hypothetical protein